MDKAVSYYYYAFINYLRRRDRKMVLAGNCGGSGEERHIKDTGLLDTVYQFGINF